MIPKKRKWCVACNKGHRENTLLNKTMGEYRNKLSLMGRHPSWVHVYVRGLCRSWNKGMTLEPCINCGYDKHVELAHVKAMSSFPDSATLGEVNAASNVKPLCRNCHWEFDNGILTLP